MMTNKGDHPTSPPHTRYTCNEYRAEMILLALQNKLQQATLSEEARREVLREIARLEKAVGLF
jgi:hypothetical protein